jgi:hypothetical protein
VRVYPVIRIYTSSALNFVQKREEKIYKNNLINVTLLYRMLICLPTTGNDGIYIVPTCIFAFFIFSAGIPVLTYVLGLFYFSTD